MAAARTGAEPTPQVTFVVAHPDDEVIGAGGTLLPRCPNCAIIHVTDGAPANLRDASSTGFIARHDYSNARRHEAAEALALAGISTGQIVDLEVADQQSSFELVDLARLLADRLRRIAPHVVITHPYEGGHPDHDSTAFAVHAARQLLLAEGAPLQLIELTSYHADNGTTVSSDFLPHAQCPSITFALSQAERELKCRMFQCFRTQREVLRWFPVDVERFRRAPCYDFTRAPHEGKLYYENFDWGMTGAHWRGLAQAAIATLRLECTHATSRNKRCVSAGEGRA
jgi:LmbE family N-acetylglucosaminyl deacetylase